MNRFCVAVLLFVWIIAAPGCSGTPPGTVSVEDLNERESELLGRDVVVVGKAETQSPMSAFNMFRIYSRYDTVWVVFPDTASMPPQGERIRVSGKLDRKTFTGLAGSQLYIEATDVSLE